MTPLRFFVTGCAGFIGSHLVERLLALGHEVVGFDNLSTGRERFLESARESPRFRFVPGDTLDGEGLVRAMAGSRIVCHLAANADVRWGFREPRKDFEQNTLATLNVLESMQRAGLTRIVFTSSASVYGKPDRFPTPESAPFPLQTSLYGASKLAGEALICAFVEGYGFAADIFRLVSILGERYSHGHVFDFYKKLLADRERIEVLGDGRQQKSYLYVQDCIDGMLAVLDRDHAGVNVFNLGGEETCTVEDSLAWICEELGCDPKRDYTGGDRGWAGDSPVVLLDVTRLRALGWRPKVGTQEAVLRTLRYLRAHPWLLSRA